MFLPVFVFSLAFFGSFFSFLIMLAQGNRRNLAEKLIAAGDGNGCGCGLFLVAVWVTDLAVFGFLIG